MFNVEKFNTKRLNYIEVTGGYQVKISDSYKLEKLYKINYNQSSNEEYHNSPLEIICDNNTFSVEEIIGCAVMSEKCPKLREQRQQARQHRLQVFKHEISHTLRREKY